MTHPHLEIIPWNGYQGAISLSFDDGLPSQIQFAIPQMAKRGICGTFYLIGNRLTEIEAWKQAHQAGQEIGNHSLDHQHAKDLDPIEAENQVERNLSFLENTFGSPIPTFAYPFTEITPHLRKAAEKKHFLSRGGYGPVYFSNGTPPDWGYVPSQVIYSHTSSGILKGWTDLNITEKTWSIPQFHAFSGDAKGWQPLPESTFIDFLDDLAERRDQIWIAPVGEIGAYLFAQTFLEKVKPELRSDSWTFRWNKPKLLPHGIRLKIQSNGKKLTQKGRSVDCSDSGSLWIDFDAEELTLSKD